MPHAACRMPQRSKAIEASAHIGAAYRARTKASRADLAQKMMVPLGGQSRSASLNVAQASSDLGSVPSASITTRGTSATSSA